MEKIFGALKWALPLSGLLVVALGVMLAFTGLEELDGWALPIGLAMILSGISELVSFKRRDKSRRTKGMAISGFIAVALGGYTAFGQGLLAVTLVLPVIFSVWVITASIPRIKEALDARAAGSPWWVFMLGFGFLGLALGALLLFHPLLNTFVATYALAFMFVIHGGNAILIFWPLSKKPPEAPVT